MIKNESLRSLIVFKHLKYGEGPYISVHIFIKTEITKKAQFFLDEILKFVCPGCEA